MKTYSAKPKEIRRHWFVIDATDQVLGRLATRVATVLRGKHKPVFTPHVDTGDFVIVTNAAYVKLTGDKIDAKRFRRYTGYPGGLVEIPYRRLLATHPERAVERAVWGMLPKGRLGRQLMAKLKVYAGPEHPHAAQRPEPLSVEGPIPVHVEPETRPSPRPRVGARAADRGQEASGGKRKPAAKPKPAVSARAPRRRTSSASTRTTAKEA